MKVLVTGATGFTGSYVVPLLVQGGYRVRCFVRPSSVLTQMTSQGVEIAYGDLDDAASLQLAMENIDFLVNLASLGFGHAPTVIAAARKANLKRALFVSTTAIFTTLNAPSKSAREQAEEAIRASGLQYIILRPTMIYGSSRDRNMCRLIRYLRRWPLIFVPGDGRGLQQPVFVGDVAEAVVRSLSGADTVNKSYNVAGATVLSFDEVIDTVCAQLNRRVLKLHLPGRPIIGSLAAIERLSIRLPIKAEQLLRLGENKAFDYSDAARDFDFRPRTFDAGIRLEIEQMGLSDKRSIGR